MTPDRALRGIPAPPEDPTWVLVRYIGRPVGELVWLADGVLEIGRGAENHLCLPEPEVSRRHARLETTADGGALDLRDLGSTNGVYVNGRRVEADPGPVRVQAGDILRVGSHAFKVKRMDGLERGYHRVGEDQPALDALTGLASRPSVLRQLESHFELARRHRRSLAVILADLDHLGRINAAHGPEAGDRVIQAFGGHLLRRLRGSDAVGRLDGEEFLVVLPETPAGPALTAADDLRLALAGQRVELSDGRSIHATCSLGVAELKPGDPDCGTMLARADVALHRAKVDGRNRVAQAP